MCKIRSHTEPQGISRWLFYDCSVMIAAYKALCILIPHIHINWCGLVHWFILDCVSVCNVYAHINNHKVSIHARVLFAWVRGHRLSFCAMASWSGLNSAQSCRSLACVQPLYIFSSATVFEREYCMSYLCLLYHSWCVAPLPGGVVQTILHSKFSATQQSAKYFSFQKDRFRENLK